MRDTKCELVRRELEELMLDEESSAAAAEHLQGCADCSEFYRQQSKLRQIVGSLHTVNAPADFDFRLRARLAADSQHSSFHFWSFAPKGLATAAVLVLFAVGAVIVWQRANQQGPVEVASDKPQPVKTEPPRQVEPPPAEPSNQLRELAPAVAENTPPRHKPERPSQTAPRNKRSLVAADFSSEGASVIKDSQNTATVFPIEASLQSFKVSLDDGRGNARTISVPTVSFGSQRVLTTANQFSTHVW